MAIFVIFFSNRSTASNLKVSVVTLSEVDRRYTIFILISTTLSTNKFYLQKRFANSAIDQLYHGENKLIFNEMMMRAAFY
jgi:hypothetical protein